ncbi:MAG: UDP-N-acetylmuramoyl-tripeptide--D-alanyl-D-alanine ligase [Phycisphaerales bacterium]
MSFWTLDSLRAALEADVLAPAAPARAPTATPAGVSIDSRSLQPGQVFVALRGDTFDGHAFLPQAAAAGAPIVVIDRPEARASLPSGVGILLVPDARAALARLARAYRATLTRTRVIGVGGSNGKTTTTRLIDAALRSRLTGTCSLKSFNNDVGVPLTVLAARPADQYLICEIGSNAPGEITPLARIARPNIGVITSIGREHLQGFGSLEGVAREEASLLPEIGPAGAGSAGVAIVTADAPLLAEAIGAARRRGTTVLTFGRAPDADLRLARFAHVAGTAPGAPPGGSTFELASGETFTVPLLGEHNALNALAAIAVARQFGLSDAEIAQGLRAATPPEMRFQHVHVIGIDLVNDAYNANPESTLAALRTFASLHAGAARRVVVLGDNLELGASADQAHRELGRAVADHSINLLIAVGPLASIAADEALRAARDRGTTLRTERLPDLNDARAQAVASWLAPGDAVLLKGSRRMALERVIPALRARAGQPASPVTPAPAPTSAARA